jgi:hypothetical protein
VVDAQPYCLSASHLLTTPGCPDSDCYRSSEKEQDGIAAPFSFHVYSRNLHEGALRASYGGIFPGFGLEPYGYERMHENPRDYFEPFLEFADGPSDQ